MTKEDAIKRIMWFRDDSGVLNIKDLQALDMAIEALQNTRPAPDQDGAEEVLKNLFGSGSFQFSYSIDQCLQAMTTNARNEVAKAVQAKDAEIDKLNDSITELLRQLSVRPEVKLPSEKEYDFDPWTNGWNACLAEIKRLNRID